MTAAHYCPDCYRRNDDRPDSLCTDPEHTRRLAPAPWPVEAA